MPLDDVFDDGQAKPGSARSAAAAWIGAIEPPGQMRQVFGGDAGALIGHREPRQSISATFDRHHHWLIFCPVFQRVIDQVAQQLFKLAGIGEDHCAGLDIRQRDAFLAFKGRHFAYHPCRQLRQIDRFAWPIVLFCLDVAERHQILDQREHAPGLAVDNPDEPVPRVGVSRGAGIAQRLSIADHRRQRGAQFVAGIGNKIGVSAADVGFGGTVGQLDHPAIISDRPAG